MVENFIRELNSLPENEKIMGIYGNAHAAYLIDLTGKVPSMIAQLREYYKDTDNEVIQVYDLIKDSYEPPLGTDYFLIKGKTYKATYFGQADLTGWDDYKYWEI